MWTEFDDFAISTAGNKNKAIAHVAWAAYASLEKVGEKNVLDQRLFNSETKKDPPPMKLNLDGQRHIIAVTPAEVPSGAIFESAQGPGGQTLKDAKIDWKLIET